ncbi:tripartite tricarboxylate transporter substrate binding protein [Roseomonas stagni]|uniref:Tripartite tricarboxylate transporter substrate binding protein n=1 Tax=Falsiroseomonas algicola TaxID=2716930 RepID=A0A6M1LGQ8_9PROT|nr:tripartite tricarboxylate transporter substrate binding protein [Falsiroseomonas algicola]NGM19473.1 tripartite tricarboxylate transporter substrate binding protein [Falsiroseomonas algicola]
MSPRFTRRALTLAALALPATARAQDYPSRPVRIVAPVAPGGSTDLIGRVLAEELNRRSLGQFFVENRPGAGSNLAYAHVATQPADGHTLLIGLDSLTVNPTLYARVEYDPVASFAPVTLMARIPHILVTHLRSPINDFAEFMRVATAEPDRLNVAVSGIGSGGHLSGAVIQHQTRARWTIVPYRGGATPINDLIAGNVDAAFVTLGAVIGHVRGGRLRALAITTPNRFPLLPDVPTVAEIALPGYDVPNWYGMLAPAGTPAPIIARLNTIINDALTEPRVRATLLDNGFEIVGGPPEVLGNLIRESVPRWATLVRAANMRAE